jgi:hypothetical protein
VNDDPKTVRTWLRRIGLALLSGSEDLSIGHIAFVSLALGGLAWTTLGDLPAGDYVGAIAAGSGLLAVGHGIRHRRRP